MAEGVGFEPTRAVTPWRFSRPLHSSALPPLRATNILASGDAERRASSADPSLRNAVHLRVAARDELRRRILHGTLVNP